MPRAKKAADGAAKPKAPRQPKGHKLAPALPNGEILTDNMKKQWKLGDGIGQGGFGLIYLASNDVSSPVGPNSEYCVKIEPKSNGPLFCEIAYYQRVAKPDNIEGWCKGKKLKYLSVSKFIATGLHNKDNVEYRFLVMQRFGTDLQKIFESCGKEFSQETVAAIGLRLLDGLEFMHDHDYAHADIKAANLLLGCRKNVVIPDEVYIVDFGLAYRYNVNGRIQDYKEDPRKAHDGTVEFTSRDAHLGVSPSRRGDLEILSYCMLQWLCGKLPWENKLTDKNYVRDQKIKFMNKISELMKACFPQSKHPGFISDFLTEVSKTEYTSRPDYNKLRTILRSVFGSGWKKTEWTLGLPLTAKPAAKKATKRKSTSPVKTPAKKSSAKQPTNKENDCPAERPKSAKSKPDVKSSKKEDKWSRVPSNDIIPGVNPLNVPPPSSAASRVAGCDVIPGASNKRSRVASPAAPSRPKSAWGTGSSDSVNGPISKPGGKRKVKRLKVESCDMSCQTSPSLANKKR